MSSWMRALARHYDRMRREYPLDDLLILFDIDGTIVDLRDIVLKVLLAYDGHNGTSLFRGRTPADVRFHENEIERLLEEWRIPEPQRPRVLDWYRRHRWSRAAVFASHRPFRGVMEVIRWFQLQPRTFVGINTGTPEAFRADTRRLLDELGRGYRVAFADELIAMNPGGWDEGVAEAKAAAVRRFRRAGYRVFAVVDNEPANLTAVSKVDAEGEILLLHAETVFASSRASLPAGAVAGADYDLTELVTERDLPGQIELVWHGLNDEANLRQFLASTIRWAELDVRSGPDGRLILRHDSFERTPRQDGEEPLVLDEVLDRLARFDKAAKLDLKEGGPTVDRVIAAVGRLGDTDGRVWVNGNVDVLGEDGFRRLRRALPGSILQCPVDFLAPLVVTMPEEGRRVLDRLRGWGIDRFSVKWGLADLTSLLDAMDRWGLEVNIYNVPDLESFLRAVLLQPRSVTSDFNFPEWRYYGHGSGEGGRRHEYTIRAGEGAEGD